MPCKSASATELATFKACKHASDLALLFDTSERNLRFHLYSKKRPAYTLFEIPKASGQSRAISVPPYLVRRWQRKLLTHLTALYQPKEAVHGFRPGRSIKSNAAKHAGKRLVLNLDLADFFPTIHFGRIQGLFRKPPFDFSHTVATILAQLCTHNSALPQGAPTSPMLTNFVCRRLDNDLARLASKSSCTYTRFADDLSFSTNEDQFPAAIVHSKAGSGPPIILGAPLLQIIHRHEFAVHEKKTRIQPNTMRQEVTGLVVNERVNLSRTYVRELRAILRNWETHGERAVAAKFEARDAGGKTRSHGPPTLARHIRGKLEFMRMVRGKGDAVHARYCIQASKLPGYFARSALLEGAASRVLEFLSEALWIVAGYDSAEDIVTSGTAFQLEAVGFVTALHVIHQVGLSPPPVKWGLIRSCDPWDQFPIQSYRCLPKFDLTVLTVPTRSHAILRRSKHSLVHDAHVTVVGFPSWQTFADKPLIGDTRVVQMKTLHGSELASVSYALLSGASGGPVLDKAGHVTGVIVTNKDHAVVPNGFLNIKHVDDVLVAPSVKL